MSTVQLLFPNQLFKKSPLVLLNAPIYLVEEFLFFQHFTFHKQKIAFHRASMKAYEAFLKDQGLDVQYVEAIDNFADIRKLIYKLGKQGVARIHYIDPSDNWLQKRIEDSCKALGIETTTFESPLFLNEKSGLSKFFCEDKKSYHQTTFYIEQRKLRKILIAADGRPDGGKWTFDRENRKKYPAKKRKNN